MISKIGNPDIFSPSKNPLYWYFDSTNKNEEGFKYLIDVYSANTLTVLQQYSVWPRPDDKYCEIGFTGLKDYCTKSINQILSGFSTCPETHVKYDVKVGEEYVFYWDYDDFYFANAVLSASSYGSNVVLSSFTEDHLYVVGDVINVVQDSLTGQTNIDGVQVVVEVPNARCIVLGLLFTTSAGAIGGTVTYSDLHKTQYSGLTSYTQYIAFNGSVTYKDFIDYDSNDYLISTATTGQFLTNAPSSYPVRSENNIYLNFYSLSSQTQATFLFISTSDGGLYRIPQGSLTANSNSIMTVNVGPSDYPSSIVAVSGTLPPIKSSTTYFDVYLTTSALIKSSETRRFAIEDNLLSSDNIKCKGIVMTDSNSTTDCPSKIRNNTFIIPGKSFSILTMNS